MNKTQLYLSIGVPTMAVILGWLSYWSDINRLIKKIDRMIEASQTEMAATRSDHHKDNLALMGSTSAWRNWNPGIERPRN